MAAVQSPAFVFCAYVLLGISVIARCLSELLHLVPAVMIEVLFPMIIFMFVRSLSAVCVMRK